MSNKSDLSSTPTEQQPWDVTTTKIAQCLGQYEPLPAVTNYIQEACEQHAAALTQENERLANITRIQQKQIERLMDERDSVKQQNQRLREAIEPLLAEVKNLRDTLSASSLELDMQVADGWHALIKPVDSALEGKDDNA